MLKSLKCLLSAPEEVLVTEKIVGQWRNKAGWDVNECRNEYRFSQ